MITGFNKKHLREFEKLRKQYYYMNLGEVEQFSFTDLVHELMNKDTDIKCSSSLKQRNMELLYKHAKPAKYNLSCIMDLLDEIDEMYMNGEDIIPFKMDILNDLFGGGGRRKSLACFVGRTNIGKSLHLCHYAADFLRMGYNVLYISGEMSEKMTFERVDSNMTDIPTSDFTNQTLDMEKYLNAINENKKYKGTIKVKEFPTKTAHAGHIKKVIKELKQKQKFIPDVIIIDYLNLFLPQRKTSSGNDYSEVKAVAEELRGLCVEENVFGITATQLNRSGSKNQEHADETDVSDSYGISMTMDVIVGIWDNEDMIEQFMQGLSLWKTRFSRKGSKGQAFVNVEWDYMRLREINELTETLNEPIIRSESVQKMANRAKVDNDIKWG